MINLPDEMRVHTIFDALAQMTPPPWTAQSEDGTVTAAQHFCGPNNVAVNAYVDEHDNWRCPNCGKIYGARQQS